MELGNFKDFYLNCFADAKKASLSPHNRVINSRFLEYMLGTEGKCIQAYKEGAISNIFKGSPPSSFADFFNQNKNIITSISKVIEGDLEKSDLTKVRSIIGKCNISNIVRDSEKVIKILSYAQTSDHFLTGIKWWFVLALMQDKISVMHHDQLNKEVNEILNNPIFHYASSAIDQIEDYLKQNGLLHNLSRQKKSIEIPYKYFHELRRLLIDNARGKLYISGSTLGNAFSSANTDDAVIIDALSNAVIGGRINEVNVFIMDPGILGEPNLADPIGNLNANINALINNLSLILKTNNCKLNVYFLPFYNIDHVIMTEDVMLYRSTKLWTRSRDYKGSIMLFYKSSIAENDYNDQSEYEAQKKYFEALRKNSVLIRTDKESKIDPDMPAYLKTYFDIRNSVYKYHNMGYYQTDLFKVYNTQLKRYIVSSFMVNRARFTFNFHSKEFDLFDSHNLLDDTTQRVLLPYIKETQLLLNSLVKKYDNRNESGARVIPSLDLGYPNNIIRLAGGFATGMLIDWECGTPIIPIDATVNVCSSSIFKINPPEDILNNFKKYVQSIENGKNTKRGYSFSFKSGNHFLMIATDELENYYLVLHSSPKDMKESYVGLYPIEDNWYSSKIKTFEDRGRIIRYIKGVDAEYFIKTAHNYERFNEDIHKWIACQFNWDESICPIIKHHYYMPTDSSIAIGTFTERPGEIVPMFSNVGKPVYLFEIGKNNWTYDLGGRKGEVCIVPHGWGQQIENIVKFAVNNNKLCFDLKDGRTMKYDIVSSNRIKNELDSESNPENNKMVRNFESGDDFLRHAKGFIDGKIVKTLTPKFLYCDSFTGKLEDK